MKDFWTGMVVGTDLLRGRGYRKEPLGMGEGGTFEILGLLSFYCNWNHS